MPAMLQLENISTHYGAICAVDSVSLHVNQGEIVSLIGSNGAGKTSLLMTVCGTPARQLGPHLVRGRGHHPAALAPHHAQGHRGLARGTAHLLGPHGHGQP